MSCAPKQNNEKREAALEIVFATCEFWAALDGFKSLLMRGVSKQIKDKHMKPMYIAEVVYKQYMFDLDAYLLTRRIAKQSPSMARDAVKWRRPPACPWHDSRTMLTINWTSFTQTSIPWDWTGSPSVQTQRIAGLYLVIFKRMAEHNTAASSNQATELLGMMKHALLSRTRDKNHLTHVRELNPIKSRRTRPSVFISQIVQAIEKDIQALADNEVASNILDNRANEFD